MIKKLLFLSLTFITSCNYSLTKTQSLNPNAQKPQTLPIDETPKYSLIASAIIAPKCLECHSNGGGNAGGVNLESYDSVNEQMASIRAEVTSGRMPKNRIPLTANEKEFFIRWMDLGAPRESEMKNPIPLPVPDPAPIPVPSPPPPPIEEPKPELDNPDYQLVRTQIIVPRCLGCHSDAGKNKGGVNLETYQNIYELKDLIKEEIESNSMPKPTTRPLTVAQKQMLLLWLDIGAPEKNIKKMSEEK